MDLKFGASESSKNTKYCMRTEHLQGDSIKSLQTKLKLGDYH